MSCGPGDCSEVDVWAGIVTVEIQLKRRASGTPGAVNFHSADQNICNRSHLRCHCLHAIITAPRIRYIQQATGGSRGFSRRGPPLQPP
jgi:hypothetical protein